MARIRVGSLCSGIEAASVAWKDIGFEFDWFSEISTFPCKVLEAKFPNIINLGDMCELPQKLLQGAIDAPDLICGGTPCQAFSLAGWKKGLVDDRGNLTLKFVDVIEANDLVRTKNGLQETIVFWENVEGVLRDKTNAFGCLLSSLAGFEAELKQDKWPNAGVLRGPKRNIAWRVLDAKYFGLPQQRRRLYLLAGGKDFYPENILFDGMPTNKLNHKDVSPLLFMKDGHEIEVFRSYTDCLYAAYGTKWNGNAAAYNGSLFVCQNGRLRRLSPLECERLMGFPDNYTDIPGAKPTNRYQAVGNSWAVPVVRWIGERILSYCNSDKISSCLHNHYFRDISTSIGELANLCLMSTNVKDMVQTSLYQSSLINASEIPEYIKPHSLFDIIDVDAPESIYITPVGCHGILRRKEERRLTINKRLEAVLSKVAGEWASCKIEVISRKQKRGRFSSIVNSDEVESTGT